MSNTITNTPQVNTLPVLFPVNSKPKADVAPASAASASPTSASSSQTSLNALGSTFLKLLTQELQNQDPTAPVDSTQMVGQMISLNQLDQIASINQLLTTAFGSSSTAAGTGAATGTGTSQNAPSAQNIASAAAAQTDATAAVQAALAGLNSGAATAAGLSSTGFPNF